MSGKEMRVLVVAAADAAAARIVTPFETAGYSLTYERVDSAAAMSRAVADQAWDLVVCSDAPSLACTSALEILDQRALDTPVVVVSDTISDAAAQDALEAGASDAIPTSMLPRLVPIAERALRYSGITRQHKVMQ